METTLRNVINLFGNLRSLNGREVVVESGDQKKVIFQPYQFEAKTTWRIAKNMNLMKPHVEVFETARAQLLENIGDVNADAVKRKKFAEGVNQMLDETIKVEGIVKLSLTGLQLDKNAIQPGLLADLAEIITEE